MEHINVLLPIAGSQRSILPWILIGAAVIIIAVFVTVNIIKNKKG